jgi:hypothetical protein
MAWDVITETRFVKTFLGPTHDTGAMASALANLEGLSTSMSLLPQVPISPAFVNQLTEYRVRLERMKERQGKLYRFVAQLDDITTESERFAQECDSKRVADADRLRTVASRLQATLDARLGAG